MHGDFTRVTFAPAKHYSAVLTQQGRVQLDADANEQAALVQHYLRALAADLIGPHGGRKTDAPGNFEITVKSDTDPKTLDIAAGRYYVDGILCQADHPLETRSTATETWQVVPYFRQPDAMLDPTRDPLPTDKPLLVYLKVFERLITAIEDPEIRERALGLLGPDTAARARVVWQVRVTTGKDPSGAGQLAGDKAQVQRDWDAWAAAYRTAEWGRLRARAKQPPGAETDLCVRSPEARFRGAENQLYRVEVNTGGAAGTATFKWSRDNGAVATAIASVTGPQVVVESLGRDGRLAFDIGNWVEVIDDRVALRDEPTTLHRITGIDQLDRRVTLDAPPSGGAGQDPTLHPLLRRWDHTRRTGEFSADNAVKLKENQWIDLEDGVQVLFVREPAPAPAPVYRRNDFWLIPARTVDGDVEWPGDVDQPAALPPHGVADHHAPLATVRGLGGTAPVVDDLRYVFSGVT